MTDHVDFDKLASRLFKCEAYQTITPWDIQDKFNKLAKKSNQKPKKSSSKLSHQRKKEQLKLIATESLTYEDSGLTREEKRISRQIFLMEQLEESKMPKKIKKQRNMPKLNEKIQWEGLSIAEYLQRHLAHAKSNIKPAFHPLLPTALAEGLKDITSEYNGTPLFKPEDGQPLCN